MDKLRVALIGPGRIAPAHLNAVVANADSATLVAVAGLPEEVGRTNELVARFGAERADTVEGVIEADDLDAVILTVPNFLHHPLALRVLEAGKHVLIEKPLATNLEECDSLIATAAATGLVAMAGHCRRHFDGARIAQSRMADLGRPVNIVSFLGVFASEPKVPWWTSAASTGGMVLGLNGPHVLDTMVWLIDAAPVRVYATGRRLRPHWEGDDEVTVVVDFADGSSATGHLSVNMRQDVNERWITGPEASMRLQDDRTLWFDDEQLIEQPVTSYIDGDVSFDRQFAEFVSAITEDRQPATSAAAVRPTIAIMQAAFESAATGLPVDLTRPPYNREGNVR